MTPLPNEPIPLEPRNGGPLNWFDHVDDQFRVRLSFVGAPYPKTALQRERWLIDQLRSFNYMGFFFETLAHKGLALDFQLLKETHGSAKGRYAYIEGSVPLAQLFLLPNVDPAQELAQMKEFLAWLDSRLQGQGREGDDASLQWFRGGYGSRGLDAVHFVDKDAQKQLTKDIHAWREKPWFDAWYLANMKGFGKIRRGPHCWLTTPSLVPCRRYARISAEVKARR